MIDKLRYFAGEIAENGRDSYWWRQRFTSRVIGPLLGHIHQNHGEDFMNRDWDNLLILDACRADMFEEVVSTDQFDNYESINSIGCSSPEWMRKSFENCEYPDTVYVTANPWISKVAPRTFHDIINLWTLEHEVTDEELSDVGNLSEAGLGDVATIYADQVNKYARRAHEQYPDKRLIIHYFQPHAPCIGNPDGSRKDSFDDKYHPGDDLKAGNVTKDEVWEQYTDNLGYVFYHANNLVDDIGGRSVFTADHGELFGEWLWPFPMRGYAHPSGVRHPKLTQVPWAVKEGGKRRRIVAGEVELHETDEDEIDDRLRNLGYKP